MKAIVKEKDEYDGTELKTVSIPKLSPDNVLVKPIITSICGTDVHIYKWNDWAKKRIRTPLIYGHEMVGEITEVGDRVKHLKVGDYVSVECHIACGRCYNCMTGNGHICENVSILGVDCNGVFAEYVSVPAKNIWINEPDIPPEICSIQDPLGNAVHAVFSADIPTKTVAVFGCGPIGVMAVALCKFIGASTIFAVGRKNEYRMKLAKKMGADRVMKSKDATSIIMEETDGKGADVVLEMSGSGNALNQGLEVLRAGGTIAILGVYNDSVEIDVNRGIVFKYATVKGINGRLMYDTWYRMRALFHAGFDVSGVITHKYKFSEFKDAMKKMISKDSGKIVIDMS